MLLVLSRLMVNERDCLPGSLLPIHLCLIIVVMLMADERFLLAKIKIWRWVSVRHYQRLSVVVTSNLQSNVLLVERRTTGIRYQFCS